MPVNHQLRKALGITEPPKCKGGHQIATAADIRALRLALGLTQRQLAKHLGMNSYGGQLVAAWETECSRPISSGAYAEVLLDMLTKARELGVLPQKEIV